MEPGLIYQRIIAILNGVDFIGKDKKNTQQNYNFRGIDDVYNELHPVFAKNGVFICPNVVRVDREERQSKGGGALIYTIVDVRFTFYTVDGSCVESTMTGEAMDSGDKGCNKAMSAALKYALMQMFLIPTIDTKDTEEQTHEVKSKEQERKEEAISLIEKCRDVEDLKQLKEMYKDLFSKDQDVKSASKAKYEQINKLPNI
jgi:hypothetical protein